MEWFICSVLLCAGRESIALMLFSCWHKMTSNCQKAFIFLSFDISSKQHVVYTFPINYKAFFFFSLSFSNSLWGNSKILSTEKSTHKHVAGLWPSRPPGNSFCEPRSYSIWKAFRFNSFICFYQQLWRRLKNLQEFCNSSWEAKNTQISSLETETAYLNLNGLKSLF